MIFKIPKFLKKKRNIWIILILLILIIGGWLIFGRSKANTSIQVGTASKQNLEETVLSTGQVVSSTDLSLSFQGSGIVRKILVKEGDKVVMGQVLAALDQSSSYASLTTAQGALAQAQANYEKLVAGASQENIQTVKDSIASAKQDLNNAYNSANNTLNSSYTSVYTAYSVVTYIQNTYFSTLDQQGTAVSDSKSDMNLKMQDIKKYLDIAQGSSLQSDIDIAISKASENLDYIYNDLNIIRSQCDIGTYYIKVAGADKTSLDAQKINISTAGSSVDALQHSIASYKIALQKANDQLNLTIAPPTQSEIDLAKAQILSAQGQVDSAQTLINNSVIMAPESGTITQVDVKVGEQATAMKEAIMLQDIGNLHAEAAVSEANIASLQVGQEIDYTFDALSPDQHFTGKVLTINPASTVISGVVNYLVKGSFDNVPNIKPGMTANMTILVAKKDNVLSVPSTAVINKNNKYYVRVVDDSQKKTYHEVEVKTGLQADGGLVEIVSGLSDGQSIITYMKQ
jgi:HlyD family secretion protein